MIITIAQLNPYVGDLEKNLEMIKHTLREESTKGTELLVFPELFLVGYPPKGLLERAWFIEKAQEAIEDLQIFSRGFPRTAVLLGTPRVINNDLGKGLANSAVLVGGGEILFEQAKTLLPGYDLFDEQRYFKSATEIDTVDFHGEKLGIFLGEDACFDVQLWPGAKFFLANPAAELKKKGATLFINLAAFPFYRGAEEAIYRLFSEQARQYRIPLVYANQVGANDELVFAGRSFCLDGQGQPLAVLEPFQEQVMTINTEAQGIAVSYALQEEVESVYEALVLGIKDYFKKTGFQKALLGLSGGIDSALVCALAVAALGKSNVMGISLPSPFSSHGSVEDSRKLAENLGIEFKVIPISGVYQAYLESLQESFADRPTDITEENIQARIRGNILMAFANKFGYLVLTTGNKSELSVGYCTLYGDMSGGLSVISDVPKTMVYQLSHYLNREKEIIPEATLEKAPSAELRPEQKDEDTLPSYEILDGLLSLYLDENYSSQELVQKGFAAETVNWVVRAVERNEYKRRQAVLGLKVNTKPWTMDRRMPIAAKKVLDLKNEVEKDG